MRQRWLNIHTFQLTSLLKWHCTISLYCLLLGTQSFKTMHVHYHLSVLKPFRSLWSGVITTLTIKKKGVISHLYLSVSAWIWSDLTTALSPLSYLSLFGVALSLAALAGDFFSLPAEGVLRRQLMMEGGWWEAEWKDKSKICVLWVAEKEDIQWWSVI